MFYSMTRLHYPQERMADLLGRAEAAVAPLRDVAGLQTLDFVTTGEGQGMLMAVYSDPASHDSAGDAMSAFLAEIGEYLTSEPHGHEGTVEARLVGSR